LLVCALGADCTGGVVPDPTDQAGNGQPSGDNGSDAGDDAGDDAGGNDVDQTDSQAAAIEAQLNGKVLTEIRSSNNIDPLGGPAFLQFFRSDLELCSNGRFEYFEVDETTISFVVERNEFSGAGEWSVRVDQSTGETFLKLNFLEVSEGELFEGEALLELNLGGESFLGGTRVFVTDGDDVCE
jgi:hypothetical protein